MWIINRCQKSREFTSERNRSLQKGLTQVGHMKTLNIHAPLRPEHSMSKLRIRRGAIFDHSPSGGCEMISSHEMSTSIWHRVLRGREFDLPFCEFSPWRSLYLPAGISSQLHPTMLQSTMNLQPNIYYNTLMSIINIWGHRKRTILMYKTEVWPNLIYGWETWLMSEKDEKAIGNNIDKDGAMCVSLLKHQRN